MQVFIFLTCTSVGILSGVVYDILYIARLGVCGINKQAYTVKDKIFTAVCDVLYLCILTAAFIFTLVLFDFYEPRLYMIFGCVLGIILYLKSIHVFVAFCAKRVYNVLIEKKERKNSEKVVQK